MRHHTGRPNIIQQLVVTQVKSMTSTYADTMYLYVRIFILKTSIVSKTWRTDMSPVPVRW